MLGLVYDGKLSLREVPRPVRPAGEALVKVLMSGFCRTDFELTQGYHGFSGVLGHEFVGRVEEADDHSLIGRRVVGDINVGCGRCDQCRRFDARHCPSRTAIGILGRPGCFADYLVLPEANLHLVPDQVPDAAAVFTEPLAAMVEMPDQVHIRPTSRALVVGDGRIGLLAAQVLRLTGAEVHLVGRHEDKLDIVRHVGVITHQREGFEEKGFDVVVEASGSVPGLSTALDAIKPRGLIFVKSTHIKPVLLDMTRVVVNEVTLVGSRCGPFAPALALLSRGLIEVAPLITRVFSFQQAEQAFNFAWQKGVIKVLMRHEE
ncbi:MAG: alcohol dehydrogenase catalytic domain-containing protein [Deltaproteobacteria bacterium]|nr:alcohol dehydrogenase catalytic domain-containing protein [Deltaproteobacteria bacterium]